jgi:hypothetical protein
VSESRCWFCGAPGRGGDELRVDLYRDVQETFTAFGSRRRQWRQTWVDVPRCRRCRTGHGIERAVRYVFLGTAGLTALTLFAWVLSRPWEDEWQLLIPVACVLYWLVMWLGVRKHWFGSRWLAPRPRRHALDHPRVEALIEAGWSDHNRPD